MMIERKGWLLDIFPAREGGVSIWQIGDDGVRRRFLQHFPVTFYVAGPDSRLQQLADRVQKRTGVRVAYTQRYEIFAQRMIPVMAVEVDNTYAQPHLFREMEKAFPDLSYYDADVSLPQRHAAVYDSFPLARCRIMTKDDRSVELFDVQDDPWELKMAPAKILSRLYFSPDCDPDQGTPQAVLVEGERKTWHFSLASQRSLLINLRAILKDYDPDIILTHFGDTWLLPELFKLQKEWKIELPWNREPGRTFSERPERYYFSYGRIVYRGHQVHLYGRTHIDLKNALLWRDYDLTGVLETARVTRLSIQNAARQSPGTGISSMQIVTALKNAVLVPYQKQQAEELKTGLGLLASDRGGLAYQPIIGLHKDVAEIDFVSMYPSIMVKCNISPETRPNGLKEMPESPPGLIPQTLAPLLQKRINIKAALEGKPSWDPEKKVIEKQASAQKWLLVTCFGYLGYKNARFGRIESHEAVTRIGREALLRAKEAAETLGFQLLHMYVDGLWVRKAGLREVPDFQDLLELISAQTGLSISLDGIYRWVVFLGSRSDGRVPVANRYFGVFQDGRIKTRGIEVRRRDMPPFIKLVQMEMLKYLAQAESADLLQTYVPGALHMLRGFLTDLMEQRVPLEDLLLKQRLSRELTDYRVLSASARAAKQLKDAGKTLLPGQSVKYLYARSHDRVIAWDIPASPNPDEVDYQRYADLVINSAETILEPMGWCAEDIRSAVSPIPAVQLRLW